MRYGVLEGAEHGVYLRGITTEKVITLPEHWKGLVHEDSITVQLTPIGNSNTHFLVKVQNNEVHIDSSTGEINVSFFVLAERKDVERMTIEYIQE